MKELKYCLVLEVKVVPSCQDSALVAAEERELKATVVEKELDYLATAVVRELDYSEVGSVKQAEHHRQAWSFEAAKVELVEQEDFVPA